MKFTRRALVAAAAICFLSVIDPPGIHGNLGAWMMGFGWRGFGFGQALQAAVPLALAAWLLWPSRSQPKLVSA